MTWDHERVEELLAAHAVGGLEGEDAELAERALVEHVPGCPRCLRSAEAYRRVAGDLALLATPVEPPETLRGRVRRTAGRRSPRRLGAGWAAAAVVTAAAVSLAVWNLSLARQLNEAEVQQGWIADALSTAALPDARTISLTGPTRAQVTLFVGPTEDWMYVLATGLPEREGVYRIWFMADDRAWTPGVLQITERGLAGMAVQTDLQRWDSVMVTHEPDDDRPGPAPSPLVSATVDS